MKFGEYLITNNIITSGELGEVLDLQRYQRTKTGRLLRDLGHITQRELNQQLQLFFQNRVLPSAQSLSTELKSKRATSNQYLDIIHWTSDKDVTFLRSENGILTFLSSQYLDEILELAEEQFKKPCELIVLDSETLTYIRSCANFSSKETSFDLRIDRQVSEDQKIGAKDPYTSLFRDTILAARSENASDIHIQPTRDGLSIRFRINGDLQTWKLLSLEHRRTFINEVKRLTNLSIGISGKAQDGRISFKAWNLDLRASLLPSQYGEKIVLRLLDLTRQFELESLGFDSETTNDLKSALQSKNGVLIISGPTGSGKTTTLYTLLCALDRSRRNIVTLEDPIEYGIEGLTQVQVSKKLTFAEALRSVLRQDPDVLLVGEIRDAETADLCIKAASTGHLVLSTLHANGAAEVVGRLVNLGVDPYMLKSVLRFSSAQRLVKRLCSHCSIQVSEVSAQDLDKLSDCGKITSTEWINFRTRNPIGCASCKAGIAGRVPVLEYMRSDQIKTFLSSEKQSDPELSVSLKEACLKRAKKGEVDFHEVYEIE